MSLMTPPWPYSAVQVLRVINTELALRLNSSPSQMGPAWIVESGQMALSKPGSFRVVWSLQGGPVEKGFQFHGPDMPAPGIATRLCRPHRALLVRCSYLLSEYPLALLPA